MNHIKIFIIYFFGFQVDLSDFYLCIHKSLKSIL